MAPPGPLVTEDRILFLFFREIDGTLRMLILCGIFLFIYFVVCHRHQASVVSASLRSGAATVAAAAAAALTISYGRSVGISSQLDLRVGALFIYLFILGRGVIPRCFNI